MFLKSNSVLKALFFLLFIFYNASILIATPYYFGNLLYYFALCILINFLLYFSFFKSKYYFNFFIAFFVLFGYGFKLTFSFIFYTKNFWYSFSNPFNADGGFFRILSQKIINKNQCAISDSMQLFDDNIPTYERYCEKVYELILNPNIYDKGMIFSIVGIFSFLFSMIIFEKISVNISSKKINLRLCTSIIYDKFRFILIAFLFFLIISIFYVNFYFSIYQKGITANSDVLPIFRNLIAWLLMFGLMSFICNLLYAEYLKGNKIFKIILFFSFLEPFLSNISMISRGFIFNAFSIIMGYLKVQKKINFLYFFSLLTFVLILFLFSIKTTQEFRKKFFYNNNYETSITQKNYNTIVKSKNNEESNILNRDNLKRINNQDAERTQFFNITLENKTINFLSQVIIERWVGLEEVMLTLENKNIGWNFLMNSFKERQSDKKIPLFDRKVNNEYLTIDRKKNNFVSTPGIIAYASFSNNLMFVFFFINFVTFFCLFIEFITKKTSYNNLFLSALIGQILAYRLVHFGVYPIESYKLLIAIIFTIFLSFIFSKIFFNKLN